PEVGGLSNLIVQAQANTSFDVLAFVPITWDAESLFGIGWSTFAGISASTFGAYVFLQWWTFRRSDGGGEFIQRLAASKDEDEAVKAAWLFNFMHYVVRTWPWILVALAALVIYPELQDKELGYPMLMLDFLPVGLLGLVVASLFAAFMSTVSTNINWGASYVVNDLYRRFVNPEASQSQLIRVGRIASVVITGFGALAAFYSDSVGQVFRLVIAIGTGPGVVLILRWFWWRVNAWAELSAMIAGFSIGLFTTLVPELTIEDFGIRLFVIVLITTAIWLTVMFSTKPEEEEVLLKFYEKVRPAGPGWKHISTRAQVSFESHLGKDILRVISASMILFGLMFGIGGLLLMKSGVAITMLLTAAVGTILIRWLK
ncbi:MAG: sodium:proline symporter, partial [Rhodothermales bacterium]